MKISFKLTPVLMLICGNSSSAQTIQSTTDWNNLVALPTGQEQVTGTVNGIGITATATDFFSVSTGAVFSNSAFSPYNAGNEDTLVTGNVGAAGRTYRFVFDTPFDGSLTFAGLDGSSTKLTLTQGFTLEDSFGPNGVTALGNEISSGTGINNGGTIEFLGSVNTLDITVSSNDAVWLNFGTTSVPESSGVSFAILSFLGFCRRRVR